MIKAFDDYTLLAGSHGRRGSIWRGPDHLLIVEGAGALYALNESYRRIDYENIQALSLVRTQRYGWLLAAFVAPMAIAALILMVIIGSGASVSEVLAASMIFGLPLVLIPFVLLVVHLARGRTVRCTLQTAVQSLRLRPLTREAWARSVIAQIAEICRSHQNVAESPPPPVVSATSWQAAPVGPLPVWSGSPVIITAAVIVFLWGAVLAGELFVGGAGYLVVDLFLGLIATLAAIVALVVAMRHQSPTGLQAMLWATSGMGVLIGFCSLVGIAIAGAILDRRGGGSSTPLDAFEYLADLSLDETHVGGWIVVGLGVLIALLGLLMVPYGVRRPGAASPIAPPPLQPQL